MKLAYTCIVFASLTLPAVVHAAGPDAPAAQGARLTPMGTNTLSSAALGGIAVGTAPEPQHLKQGIGCYKEEESGPIFFAWGETKAPEDALFVTCPI